MFGARCGSWPLPWRCLAPAHAQLRMHATCALCSTQTEDARRPAHRRLHRDAQFRPSARRAGWRRLCAARARLSRPRRHPARHRRPQPGGRARPRLRSRLSEPRQCLVRARQLRPGHRRLRRRPSSSIPIRPRLTSTAPPCGATSAISTARCRTTRRRSASSADRASAYSGRGQIYLRQHDYARAIADFDRARAARAERRQLHAAGAGARRRRRSRPRARRLSAKPRSSIRKTSPPSPREAGIWRKKATISTRRSPPTTAR